MPSFRFNAIFDRGYIAEPYWPELARLIDIQKESGVNRYRNDQKRREALQSHLKKIGMTHGDYEELERLARRAWHTDEPGEIVIPTAQVESFTVNAVMLMPAAMRPCKAEQVRSLIRFADWRTGKRTVDEQVWERYAVVQGAGGKLSNQRGLRRSRYIADFAARGELVIDRLRVEPSVLEQALRWGGENVGIGASRKMGWGRFLLEDFAESRAEDIAAE